MSYPKNAKEVLQLGGLHLATILSIIQLGAIIYLITQTDHLTEAQFSAVPRPVLVCAFLVLITSFVIMLSVVTIRVGRTYKRYNDKAQFELMLRGLLELVSTSGSTPLDAKQAFANEYLDLLTSAVAQEHLEHLPNRQGKQLLRDAVLGMQKHAGDRLVREVEGNNGIPSSSVVRSTSTDLARLEDLFKALNKVT